MKIRLHRVHHVHNRIGDQVRRMAYRHTVRDQFRAHDFDAQRLHRFGIANHRIGTHTSPAGS